MTRQTSRRTVLAVGVSSIAATSGCLGALSPGGQSAGERSIEITLSGSKSDPSVAIAPEPSVEGVVTVGVGDAVTFEFTNDLDADFGVHNHVTDEEVVVESGATASQSFDVTEDMVGRHELEGFSPGEHSEEGDHGGEDGHSDEEGDHTDETGTETHQEDDHSDEKGTETATHEEGDHSDEEGDHTGEEGGHADEVTLAVVEVRPG